MQLYRFNPGHKRVNKSHASLTVQSPMGVGVRGEEEGVGGVCEGGVGQEGTDQ